MSLQALHAFQFVFLPAIPPLCLSLFLFLSLSLSLTVSKPTLHEQLVGFFRFKAQNAEKSAIELFDAAAAYRHTCFFQIPS
jgi:hypothetical protein